MELKVKKLNESVEKGNEFEEDTKKTLALRTDIDTLQIHIDKLDELEMMKATKRWDSIAKPLNSLGKLEKTVIKLAGIFGSECIDISKKCVVVMCADNGVVEEGITQSGPEVTLTVAENMTRNKATINILSGECNAEVFVVDIGISSEFNNDRIINKKVMNGTNNLYREPAMTRDQTLQAIQTGIDMVGELKSRGFHMIATGEMGIGNTTTSSAVTACLLNKKASEVTGRGAGLSSSALDKKIKIIEEAIQLHQPDETDPIDVLAKVGGLDIAGLTGIFLGGGIHKIPILIDGFISSVAALVATRLCKESKDYMFATHISKEPAGRMLIDTLELPYLVDLHMCLGEGTGAVMTFPIFDMALAVYHRMSSFEQANIETYQKLL
ncbi:MAG TPA: nicotinate-nucleotide--dimethylbenzimidazole phosphoribosyltransferase [Mobilitalea sp.]|nr:nicotinate-nucleotide--dimethylbenzimidazole phosphoribosyltransferase [Mobilitalea sp.]